MRALGLLVLLCSLVCGYVAEAAAGSSTTTLTTSPNPGTYGNPVTLTATVEGGDAGPTGTVDFKFSPSGDPIGSAVLSSIPFSSIAASTSDHTCGSSPIRP